MEPTRKLKGAEIICESLLREGVEVIFGYPGGAILPFYDALWSYPQLRHILVRHEQSAAHAADGYSRVTGKVGVCVATSGPGATNLVTGIMGAKADSVPMVAITGQVARASLGSEAFQECDICSIAASTTKATFMVMNPADLAEKIREAFYVAQEGRPGPVLIDVPRDVQKELTDAVFPDVTEPLAPEVSEEAAERLKEAARLINGAERPLIISGHGVMTSGANKELLSLAERSGIPVITTLLGLGSFPGGHPLSMGMLGMHGMYWSNLSVNEADLIVGVGMRFDDRVTGKVDTFAPHARIIHMDIDPTQVGRNVPVEVPVVGDAKALLQKLTPLVTNTPRPDWMQYIENLKQDHPSLAIPASDTLQPQQVISALDTLVGDHRGYWCGPTPDVGRPTPVFQPFRHLRVIRRAGSDGFRAASGAWSSDRQTRGPGMVSRRRRRLPDASSGIGHALGREAAGEDRPDQQWLPGDGEAMAGDVFRWPFEGGAG